MGRVINGAEYGLVGGQGRDVTALDRSASIFGWCVGFAGVLALAAWVLA